VRRPSGNLVAALVIEQRVLGRADVRRLLENPVRDLLVAARRVTGRGRGDLRPMDRHDADFCFPRERRRAGRVS
jgi:hypothetical protein